MNITFQASTFDGQSPSVVMDFDSKVFFYFGPPDRVACMESQYQLQQTTLLDSGIHIYSDARMIITGASPCVQSLRCCL